jgi:hypothetical protein
MNLDEELPEEFIVWRFLEPKLADIVKIDTKLLWETFTKFLDRSALLLFSDLLVLLLVGCSLETLPWKAAPQEIHENVAETFEIVSSGLLSSKVGVDTHVSCGTT